MSRTQKEKNMANVSTYPFSFSLVWNS